MNKNNEVDRLSKKYDYEKRGPKAVILFHAYTGTPIDVNSIGKALERENYTVITPTFDGHDLEDPNEVLKFGIKDWLKNGEDVYETLKNDGFTDVSVFGLSLGGVIATHIMLNYDVNSYGTFSSPVVSTSDTNVPEMFWTWYKFKMKKMGYDEAEIDAKKNEVVTRVKEVLSGINQHVEKMSEQYGSVELPVFIGQGGNDQMIPAEQAHEFKNALTKANVDFHWYEDAPHVITTGRVGKELQQDLLAFLEKYA